MQLLTFPGITEVPNVTSKRNEAVSKSTGAHQVCIESAERQY